VCMGVFFGGGVGKGGRGVVHELVVVVVVV
jgi:hypothetical protein